MTTFTREDGRELQVIAGFRNRVLSYRKSVTPRSGWNDDDYARAITKRVKRGRRLIENVTRRMKSRCRVSSEPDLHGCQFCI